jgi:endonuclease/exonuclease/phosphatase family metal-dependent hydrolase
MKRALLAATLFCAGWGNWSCSTGEEPADLRVMSFNIRYGTAADGENAWNLRSDVVLAVIREHQPTVLGVQEALRFQLDQLASALPEYAGIGVGRSDGVTAGEYAAILYDRRRLEVLEDGTFWFSDSTAVPGSMSWGNRIPRVCTWARFRDSETDRTFYAFNLHWDHQSQPSRERSAELLLARIAARGNPEDPILVTGDFNAGEANPAFSALLASADVTLSDTFRALHPAAEFVGTFNSFRGDSTGEKIDAILISAEWQVLEAGIDHTNETGRYPSDHFPVTAVLRLGGDR